MLRFVPLTVVRAGALSHRPFRLLFAGQAISAVGDRVVIVALAFAVLALHGSVTDLGLVAAAQSLPLVVFVLLGGVWADRLPRQRVMLMADLVRAVAQGASAALLVAGSATVGELIVLQMAAGAGRAFFGPAATAVVPQTVPPERLQDANALIGLSQNVAAIVGPALAGALVALIGAGWGLAVDAATFVASAACLSAMHAQPSSTAPRASTLSELRAGWDAFRSRRWLVVVVAFFTLYLGFVYSPWLVLGPQVARTALGGVGAWAAISTALGIGALAGGVLGLRYRPRHPLRVALLAFLPAGPALYVLLAAHAPVALMVAFAVVDGVSGTLFNTLWYTALQRDVPPGELSRVASWDYLGSVAIQPLGFAFTGPVATALGTSTTLYGAAVLFVVLLLGVLAVPDVRNFTDPAA